MTSVGGFRFEFHTRVELWGKSFGEKALWEGYLATWSRAMFFERMRHRSTVFRREKSRCTLYCLRTRGLVTQRRCFLLLSKWWAVRKRSRFRNNWRKNCLLCPELELVDEEGEKTSFQSVRPWRLAVDRPQNAQKVSCRSFYVPRGKYQKQIKQMKRQNLSTCRGKHTRLPVNGDIKFEFVFFFLGGGGKY